MYNIRNVTEDIVWIGANDRRLALFENIFPIPEGVSYNSYLLKDEKTVLLDTADSAVAGQFFENLEAALAAVAEGTGSLPESTSADGSAADSGGASHGWVYAAAAAAVAVVAAAAAVIIRKRNKSGKN